MTRHMTFRNRSPFILVLALAIATGCGGDRAADDMESRLDSLARSVQGPSDADALADQEIVTKAGVSNASEIAVSNLAADRATSEEVKSFARDMIADHQALQGSLDSLAVRLDIAAAPPRGDTLQAAFDRRRDELQGGSAGEEWDRQFMELQVSMHENALDVLNQGATSAHDPDIRNTLQQAVSVVQGHLDRARQLHESLGGSSGDAPPAS